MDWLAKTNWKTQLNILWLGQTLDDQQTRKTLIARATDEMRTLIRWHGITELSAEGIRFEGGPDVTIPGWNLVGSVWY